MFRNFAYFLLATVVVCGVHGYLAPSVQLLQRNSQRMRLSSTIVDTPRKKVNIDIDIDSRMSFSSLQGKALTTEKQYPTLAEVKSIMPPGTFDKSTPLSLMFALQDVLLPAGCIFLASKFLLPVALGLMASSSFLGNVGAFALWAFYSVVTGTAAMGMWVTAHECGHGAFSDNRLLQDAIGYVFHSILMVPYYSWQRSHAVHHANTNHIIDGETHVPPIKNDHKVSEKQYFISKLGSKLGETTYGAMQVILHLVFGWPSYLLRGSTGGVSRGTSNHFVPYQDFAGVPEKIRKELFPKGWKAKVWQSDIGIAAVVLSLLALGKTFGFGLIAAAYGGPLLVINAWLVAYTWLQHTDVDVPHLPAENYSFIKGAFHTIDRPYGDLLGGIIDYCHHKIGSTHGNFICF